MPLFQNLARIIFFVFVTVTTASAWAALTPEQGDELFQQARKQALKGEANAVRQLNSAALSGDGVAQLYLGKLYGYGLGVPLDDVQAAQWFRKAAEQGNVEAQYQMGLGFYAGLGLAQDDIQAAQWFRRAAEQGESGAQFHLGLMYKNGRGVPQDNEQAILWFRKAAEQGSGGAQEQLAKMNAAAGQDQAKTAPLMPSARVGDSHELNPSVRTASQINTLENGYIVVAKKNGKWEVISIKAARPERLSNQEILLYPELSLAYEENGEWILQSIHSGNRYGCKVRSNKGYTPCTSALTSFGSADWFGVAGYNYYYLKKDDYGRLVTDILADPIYKNFDYHALFSKATSKTDLEHWVEKFKGKYDPDNLVLTAEQRITAFKNEETAGIKRQQIEKYRRSFEAATSSSLLQSFIKEYTTNDPENLVPKAKEKLVKVSAIETEETESKKEQIRLAADRDAAHLNSWRKTLKTGDESNCGLVIEVKRPIAKIQTASGERWLKVGQLYPHGTQVCGQDEGHARDARHNSSLFVGTRVCKVFMGIRDRISGEGFCGPHANNIERRYVTCSGRIAVAGVIEKVVGKKIQIRVSDVHVAEHSNYYAPFQSNEGFIDRNSVIWDQATNWSGC